MTSVAGLARRFGMRHDRSHPVLVSCLLPAPQFVAYIVLWIVMAFRGARSLRNAAAGVVKDATGELKTPRVAPWASAGLLGHEQAVRFSTRKASAAPSP